MTAAAPWSVKGIDPKAREVAKELARRSGMTLGEWLNRIILEDDMPEDIASEEQITSRVTRASFGTPTPDMPSSNSNSRPDEPSVGEMGRIAMALDRLTDRIEASETRTGLAVAGVEHSVRHAMARIETAEREHLSVATRFDAAAERLEAEQARAAERLRQIETEGPRSAEALKILEGRVTQAESAAPDPAELIEDVVTRLGQRLADAEARTGAALDSLRGSLGELDARLASAGGVRADLEQRLEGLAEDLTRKVEDARSEIAERLAASPTGAGVEARLDRMAEDLAIAEQRSARAIETMGREVLTMAETLNRRVRSAEQRSADAIEQVGGEIARIAGAVEGRLGRTDQLHAEALERLGEEIGKITERLTDRIMASERRAAQAIDDVGEQVARVTERIEQRHERASSDLAERLRASEERVAKLLEAARARLDGTFIRPVADDEATEETAPIALPDLSSGQDLQAEADEIAETVAAPASAEPSPSVFGAALFSRAEPIVQPALDPANPTFGAEDFEAADGFVPISEAAEERLAADLDFDERPADPQAPALSTREVIEQARAAARAAAAPRPATVHAGERRNRAARPGLFAAFKPARPASTWQTALMVAGGAAFLSVGAAGVVLMEGPGAPRELPAFAIPPRAALALTPGPTVLTPEPIAVAPTAPAAAAPTTADTDYAAVAQAVEQRKPGALARLKTLADGGLAPAQALLAHLYETGQAGVTQNLGQARSWMQRAAESGDASAMHNLALYYFRGEGGPSDPAAAARWFRQAADRGVVDSQYNLGLLYASGSGVPQDPAQAYKWFSIAANSGDPQARASAADQEGKLATTQVAQVSREVAAFQPAGGAPELPAGSRIQTRGPSVAAAQKILGRLGYYKGRRDGAPSHELKLAVSAYQRDQGLAATGSLDPATVSRLSVFNR